MKKSPGCCRPTLKRTGYALILAIRETIKSLARKEIKDVESLLQLCGTAQESLRVETTTLLNHYTHLNVLTARLAALGEAGLHDVDTQVPYAE